MHLTEPPLTHTDTVKYLHNVRVQIDRIMKTTNLVGSPPIPSTILKLMDARNWIGNMVLVMKEKPQLDRWNSNYPTFETEQKALESLNAEITETYEGLQKQVFGIKVESPQEFQAGYTKAIYYLIEASMLIKNRLDEIEEEKVAN